VSSRRARGGPFIATVRARVSGHRREKLEGGGASPTQLRRSFGQWRCCVFARSYCRSGSVGEPGGEGTRARTTLTWPRRAGQRRARGRRLLHARGRLGCPPARAATAGPEGQWVAAASHDCSPASRRGEGERGLPQVADRWDPGSMSPGKWVPGLGRK
jgi:hypothetical protein